MIPAARTEFLTTGRGLLTDRRVQAQTRAHALLPRTLFFFTLFNLSQHRAWRFSTKLTHLQVQQRGHDRHKRDNEDVCQAQDLLIDLMGQGGPFSMVADPKSPDHKAYDHRNQKLKYGYHYNRSPRT